MKGTLFFGLALTGGLLLSSPARAAFPLGKPAPAFTLKTPSRAPFSLRSLRGKVVLLDFWGPS